jgi:hypothetical protein
MRGDTVGDFKVGDAVNITGGEYKGQKAIVEGPGVEKDTLAVHTLDSKIAFDVKLSDVQKDVPPEPAKPAAKGKAKETKEEPKTPPRGMHGR